MENGNLEKMVRMLVRYRLGELSADERAELEAWSREDGRRVAVLERLEDDGEVRRRLQQLDGVDVEKALERNRKLLRQRSGRRGLRRWLPYAAVAVLGVGLTLLWRGERVEKQTVPVAQETEQRTEPGRRAELILADGSSVRLGEETERVVRDGVHEVVVKGHDVDYTGGADSVKAAGAACHIIRTPRGGEYSVTLADGTRVWLNALSELRYPVTFDGDERRVELKGEAYFEVARDEMRPFYVETGDWRVRVLGTAFNVQAYEEDACWRTTLCSGKVALEDRCSSRVVALSPGEQARCDRQSRRVEVAEVDPEVYMAWIHGEFRFDNTPVEEMFAVLQRWYRVEVFYMNASVRREVFTGKLPRFEELETILDIIGRVSAVKCTVKGNTVFVQ